MNKLLKKSIAVLLLVFMISANLSTPIYALSETQIISQNAKTQDSNVEFNAYFEGETHSKTENIKNSVKLFVNIKVKNAGYLENAVISLQNVNFKINGEIKNENVQSVNTKENKIILNKINNGSDITIEIPVSILDAEEVSIDNFEKQTITKFDAKYINANGKEKEISKEITNKLIWEGTAQSNLEAELTKYVPYSINQKYGVMLQIKVKSRIQDSKLPVKTTQINIQAPEINGVKPTSANVITNQTKATNGETTGLNFNSQNYTYDATSGKITINTSNNQNKISWLKNVQDEYLVNLNFEGKQIYDYVKANNINTTSAVESKIQAYGCNNIITKNTTTQINQTEAKGTMTDFSILSVQYINKGQIYANYSATNKKETAYAVRYTAQINNAELTENIKFVQKIDNFLTSSENKNATTVAGNNYAYNKNITVNQKMFQKILGEEGTIEIYNNVNNEKIGTINKQTTLTNDSYVLDISNSNTNQITIITSKPIAEGKLEIDIEKAIKENIDYSKNQFKKFTKLLAQVEANAENTEETKTIEVELKEPVSSAELSINKTKLSTMAVNNVELIAVLNTLDTSKALFKNPTIEIELPSQIKKVTIKDINLLLDNELKIENYSVEKQNGKQVIIIELQGEQTQYFSPEIVDKENVIAKGANIIINADIELNEFAATKSETINMYYTNENSNLFEKTEQTKARTVTSKGITSTDISIVAPEEVKTVNEISNYNSENKTASNSEGETLEVKIPALTTSKQTTIKGAITNNYTNNIENVFILGRIPSTQTKQFDSETSLGSTFDILMKDKITVTSSNSYKIYYSTNANATKELINTANNWVETPDDFSKVKSYLIAIAGEVTPETQITFSYNAEIPANISNNNQSYIAYKVYFDNKTATATIGTTKTAGLIKLYTVESAKFTVDFTTNMDKKECVVGESEESLQEKEIYYIINNSTARFYATIKNTGNVDAENVKVKINVPENTKLVLFDELTGAYEEINNIIEIGNLKAGKTEIIEFELKANSESNFDFKEREVSLAITGNNIQEILGTNKITFAIETSEFEEFTNKPNTLEAIIYSNGLNVNYEVSIRPKLTMTNVKIHVPLPTTAEITGAYWDKFNPIEAKVTRTETEAIIEVENLSNTLTNYLFIDFTLKDNVDAKYSTKIYAEADNVEKHYSNERFITIQKSNLTGEQVKPAKVYVKEGETFEYNFNLTTTGGSQSNIVFEDQLPEGVELVGLSDEENQKRVVITGEDGIDYSTAAQIEYNSNENKVYVNISSLPGGCKITIKLKVKCDLKDGETEGRQIINKATLKSDQTQLTELNSVTNNVEYVSSYHTSVDGSDSPTTPSNPNDPTQPSNPTQQETYKITGKAWVDSNKNGEREETEELLANVKVMLIYKSNSAIVKDIYSGESKITTTNQNGEYEFSNIKSDEYLVVFLYDSGKYSVTEYQKENVGESYNSDAQNMKITYEGKDTYAAVTDIIKVTNGNVRDIDVGLYEAEKFDLKLDKYISKITLTTPTIGTKVSEYNNSQLEKVEILKQNIGKSSIVVEYKIVVTNEGQVPGYVKKVVDYLPTDAKFNTEINSNWYKSDKNNTVFNASLADTEIKPGESKELTLVLSYNITNENMGTIINNNAEIYESYNKLGLEDIDSTPANMLNQEDDISKADIILAVATGKIALNIGITIAVITILVIGVYEIKKRVLKF